MEARLFLESQGSAQPDQVDCRGIAFALAQLHDAPADDGALDALIAETRSLLDPSFPATLSARMLADVMTKSHGFAADEDGDCGGEITALLQQGRGPSDSLIPLWLLTARGAGLRCDKPAFPLRQLLRIQDDFGGRVIVDCRDGRMVDAAVLRAERKIQCGQAAELDAGFFQARNDRDIMLDWRQALKVRALRLGLMQDALALAESALLFAPSCTNLWRETGIMRLRLNDLAGAAAAIEQFVQRAEQGAALMRARQLLAEIRAQMS